MDAAEAALNGTLAAIEEKMAALKQATDPVVIKGLRDDIDELKVTKTAQETAYEGAKTNYENALASVQDAQDLVDNKQAEIDAIAEIIEKLQALFEQYKPDCIFPVKWKLADKSDNYVNELEPELDLQFHKKVTGNQGSRDKYFKFTVEVKGLNPNELVYVEGVWTKAPSKTRSTTYESETMTEANTLPEDQKWWYNGQPYASETEAHAAAIRDITDNSATVNPPTEWYFRGKTYTTEEAAEAAAEAACYQNEAKPHLIADENGKITQDFYLKHDEYIKLLDMKKGATYEVKEEAEDYLKSSGTDKPAYTESSPEITAIGDVIALIDLELNDPTITPERKVELETERAELVVEKEVMLAKVHNDPTSGTLGAETVVPGSERWTYNGTQYTTEEAAQTAAKESVTGNDDDGYTFPGSKEPPYETREEAEEAAIGEIVKTNKTIRGTNIFTGYTNTRDGILPTGIAIVAGAGLAMLGIGAAGMYFFGRRKEEDDEDYEDEE